VILAKALRPPPEKWHGLEDTEIRYRQRYLDLMASKPGTSRTGFEPGSPGDVLLLRSEIIREIRNFLHSRGFVEVETPMMQAIPGGAAAQPFKTHHNALGCDFYLRIALELYLKRLLVGGVDKVFEIGRNFRNEGLSRKHNPEFTMLEAYQAFGDYESMMELVQGMVCHVAQKICKTLKIRDPEFSKIEFHTETEVGSAYANLVELRQPWVETVAGSDETRKHWLVYCDKAIADLKLIHDQVKNYPDAVASEKARAVVEEFRNRIETEFDSFDEKLQNANRHNFDRIQMKMREALRQLKVIDLTPQANGKWETRKYKDLVREKAGADWFEISPAARRQRAHDLGAEITNEYEDFEVTGAVFEKFIEPTLIQPTFVTHLPKELVPLAKLSPDDPTTVEVFECCINGQEIAPAYTEQNDPIEQRERLEHQAGGEQQKLDEDFLVALEYGMPPAGGMGMGIDRLCMMLLGQESIRDVILFPQLKPK
jgi:lysyl-tRNA synthetase class 2